MVTGKSWRQIAGQLNRELPGDWSVRGSGTDVLLVREPVEWQLCFIGAELLRTTSRMYAGVLPLFSPQRTISLEYSTETYGDHDGKERVRLTAPDAADRVREFVVEHGLEMLDMWPLEVYGKGAERGFARADRLRQPRGYWLLAPGARVLLDTGSPVASARELAEFFEELDDRRYEVEYYARLADAYEAGGRAAALAYLTSRRNEMLETLGYADPAHCA